MVDKIAGWIKGLLFIVTAVTYLFCFFVSFVVYERFFMGNYLPLILLAAGITLWPVSTFFVEKNNRKKMKWRVAKIISQWVSIYTLSLFFVILGERYLEWGTAGEGEFYLVLMLSLIGVVTNIELLFSGNNKNEVSK